jgi:hypothetical protein
MAALNEGLMIDGEPEFGGATTEPVQTIQPVAEAPGGVWTPPTDGDYIPADPTTGIVSPIAAAPGGMGGGGMGGGGGGGGGLPVTPPDDPILVPPSLPPDDPILPGGPSTPPGTDVNGNIAEVGGEGGRPGEPGGVPVQDLYPEAPEGQEMGDVTVGDVEGADVTEADAGVGDVGTPGVADGGDVEGIVDDAADDIAATVGGGEETAQTAEAMVDAELARILGQDSPLLQQARAEAARFANARGLQNSSMAAGMSYDAMVKAALPMAQQNAQQALQREMANTASRQEANIFTAEEQTRLAALEAELGQELSIFNAEQLNEAERLGAELRTALEQGDQQAYNEAALQLAELQRDAQAQQAEIDYASEEREFLETQAYNEQIIDSIADLNKQYMSGEQLIDIEHVRNTYQLIMNQNDFAAGIYDSYMGAIGAIFDDPKMSTSQAGEAIRALVDAMEGSLRMMSEINGIDFGDLGGAIPGEGGDSGGTGMGMGMG